MCYYVINIVGFTRNGSVFENQTLTFEDVYTLSYLQELDNYMPWGLPVCPYDLPYPLRIQYWNDSLYILEGIGFVGHGFLQLNANSLERELLKTMAFQNYGQYYVECGSEAFDIDEKGTLWTGSTRWVMDK